MKELDTFTSAYAYCALWTTTDENDEPLDMNYDVEDIAEETLEEMIRDCQKFQAEHSENIKNNPTGAGIDFWLTRNGHGAGFWDGDWPDDVGERLTKASHQYKEVDLYVGDDGKIYAL